MSKFLGYLKTVVKHKHYVRKYCFKARLYKQGLTHDLSKFSPTEFIESVKYYNGIESPIKSCKEENGWSKAWLHHKGRNKHHYEYWQDNFDLGGQAIQMPYKYALEQVCDYLGAGQAYMQANFSYEKEYEWWKNKISNPIAMHVNSMVFTEVMLKLMLEENSDDVLRPERSKVIYDLID